MRSILVAGAAAIALMGSIAAADPGGQGKGNGGGNGNGAKNEAHSAKPAKSHSGNGNGNGNGNSPSRAKGEARANGPAARIVERAEPQRKSAPPRKVEVKVAPGQVRKQERKIDAQGSAGNMQRVIKGRSVERTEFTTKGDKLRSLAQDKDSVITTRRDFRWATLDGSDRFYRGCPPGLAKKNNGCTPPGLDRSAVRAWDEPRWYGRNLEPSWSYRDGYMVRYSDNRIVDYLPLLGGALAVGQAWPGAYQPVNLPSYYVDYYDLGRPDSYRYYDDAIYSVDPKTEAITAVVALLTGEDITIGEPMPAGYDIYNVPYRYRDRYYDTPETSYRYSDGYIYQIDPTTRLVQAAIELLT
ncbi:hypothetical protein [Novosphingobium aquimarinum]|uniref:hypothetical protein n=1 Tax=Novosphingobium aquimarinum TaxID=2682494 RepID=UPI0012EB1176|nr:hypothetical protein [Novosphingobium aquimarinum]